ncbi:GILT-like protein 2 [Ostrinia nubilalis]|uniref:GILT-like protein 2 n=1 Tax=Ostrinia nubilalis TaxID=29057 RepID=UPI0030826568
MFLRQFILFATVLVITNSQDIEILSNALDSVNTPIKVIEADFIFIKEKITVQVNVPTLKLYYESLCPDCIEFDSTQFKNVVELLHQYVDIHTYPYGNARTVKHGNNTVIICQHGPEECYGNKLHACALDIIANGTEAMLFNACMMAQRSNDTSADNCGERMSIKVDSIKECAKSQKGTDLLVHYGEESKKVGFRYVPYVLLNGVEWQGNNLLSDLCATFKNPPEPCRSK